MSLEKRIAELEKATGAGADEHTCFVRFVKTRLQDGGVVPFEREPIQSARRPKQHKDERVNPKPAGKPAQKPSTPKP